MTEPRKKLLALQWKELELERDKELNSGGSRRVADLFEARMARIEDEFQRNDADIRDYQD